MSYINNKIMKHHQKNNSDLIINMNPNNQRGFNNIIPSSIVYTSYVTVLNLHLNSKGNQRKNAKLINKYNTKSFDSRSKKETHLSSDERRNSDTNLDFLSSKKPIENLFEKFMETRQKKQNKNLNLTSKLSHIGNNNSINSKYYHFPTKNDISLFSTNTIINEKKDNKRNKINPRLLCHSYRKTEKIKINLENKKNFLPSENNIKKFISKNKNNKSVYNTKKNKNNNILKTEKNINNGSTIQEPAHNIPKILTKRTPINFPFSSNYKNNINNKNIKQNNNDLSINKLNPTIKNIILPSKKSKSPDSIKTKNNLLNNNNQNVVISQKNVSDIQKNIPVNQTTGKHKKDVRKILEEKKISQINEFNLYNTEDIKIDNKPIKSLPNTKEQKKHDDSQIEDSYNTKEIDEKSSSSSQKSKHKSEFIKKSSPLINKVLNFQTVKNEFNNLKFKKNNSSNKRINIQNQIKIIQENSSLPKINYYDKSYNENSKIKDNTKSNNESYIIPMLNNKYQNLKNQNSKNENKEKNNNIENDNNDIESEQYVDANEVFEGSDSDRFSSTILDSDDLKGSFNENTTNNSTKNLNTGIRNSGSEQMIQKYNIFQSRKEFLSINNNNILLNSKNCNFGKNKNLNYMFGLPNNVIEIIFSYLNLDMINTFTLLNSSFHNIFKPIIYNQIFQKIKKINENPNPKNKIKLSIFKYSKLKYNENIPYSLKEEYEKFIKNRICDSESEIIKDLNRTFPDIPDFQNGKDKYNKLYHILYAYANYNEKIGYAQGLNFLAGYSIFIFDNEEECFIFVDGLIQKFKLEDFFGISNNLKNKIEIIDCHLKLNTPKVYNYLKDIHLSHEFFSINWVITLFSNSMDKDELFFLWDCLIIFGWKFFYFFIISILKKYENKILNTDVSEMCYFMKNLLRTNGFKNCFIEIMEKTIKLMQEEKAFKMFRAKSTMNSKR